MTEGRSYEGRRAGQQRYAVLEYCSKPETAWGKIESGHYDWLGIKDDQFVFGRPPAGGFSDMISILQTPEDADGRTFVEWREPKGSPNRRIFANDDEARAGFSDLLARLREPDGSSAMWRCRLIVDNNVVAQEFVVRALSNVL